MVKYMGTQGAKSRRTNAEVPDPAIRVRMFYESDSTLHLSIILVVSRNDEPSLIFLITTKTHKIYIYPISTKSRSL